MGLKEFPSPISFLFIALIWGYFQIPSSMSIVLLINQLIQAISLHVAFALPPISNRKLNAIDCSRMCDADDE